MSPEFLDTIALLEAQIRTEVARLADAGWRPSSVAILILRDNSPADMAGQTIALLAPGPDLPEVTRLRNASSARSLALALQDSAACLSALAYADGGWLWERTDPSRESEIRGAPADELIRLYPELVADDPECGIPAGLDGSRTGIRRGPRPGRDAGSPLLRALTAALGALAAELSAWTLTEDAVLRAGPHGDGPEDDLEDDPEDDLEDGSEDGCPACGGRGLIQVAPADIHFCDYCGGTGVDPSVDLE